MERDKCALLFIIIVLILSVVSAIVATWLRDSSANLLETIDEIQDTIDDIMPAAPQPMAIVLGKPDVLVTITRLRTGYTFQEYTNEFGEILIGWEQHERLRYGDKIKITYNEIRGRLNMTHISTRTWKGEPLVVRL